ncbi:PIN domain-containing protein [Kitasatospora sp. McL0602]|uniref:PIN domain-containing protein n=1 Tax=Kitasatospora sp. McL0602 TaxID=3439530 RepID=UPI003F8AD522
MAAQYDLPYEQPELSRRTALIILDSNILKGVSLRGPDAELLRVLTKSKVERVAAPWIVLEELAAQQFLLHDAKFKAAAASMEALRKATPWAPVPAPVPTAPEKVREYWRYQYSALAETIETSTDTHKQAMFREANLIAPCKTVNSGKHKTGSRDALIWLTAIEYAKANPTEHVYFVSNNTEDFGDGTNWPAQLAEDIKDLGGRFTLYTSLDGVLARFARKTDITDKQIRAMLSTPERLANIARRGRIASLQSRISDELLADKPGSERGLRHGVQFSAILARVEDPRAYEIDGHTWYTATARWLLVDEELSNTETDSAGQTSLSLFELQGRDGAYSWETRVLVSSADQDGDLTVLKSSPYRLIAPEDEQLLPEGVTADAVATRRTQAFHRWIGARRGGEGTIDPVTMSILTSMLTNE